MTSTIRMTIRTNTGRPVLEDNEAACLPPPPDPYTGEPRPPAAPAQFRGDGGAEKTPSQVPKAPDGKGPVLEYYRESARTVWLSAPAPIVILLIALIAYGGLEILTYWPLWILLGGYLAFLAYKGRSDVLTAGAAWVQFNGEWVRTYELTHIRYRPLGQIEFELVLQDRDNSVGIPINIIQCNKRLWDYVYLGMRYSANNGAELTRAIRSQFPELEQGRGSSRRQRSKEDE